MTFFHKHKFSCNVFRFQIRTCLVLRTPLLASSLGESSKSSAINQESRLINQDDILILPYLTLPTLLGILIGTFA